MQPTQVRAARVPDRDYIRATLTEHWGDTVVAGHGEEMDAAQLPALVAYRGVNRVGVVTYRPDVTAWEVVTLNATPPGAGAGTALLDALRAKAIRHDVRRLWLVVTNDDTHALRFFQRYGFDLCALHRDAVTEARGRRPGIPLENDGIPVRHELRLELDW
jgi:N-acetylglutamate synthase-like GNAT family acetyltransferase